MAEFQASFVPAEAEEEAGPAPETVSVNGSTLRFLKTGEGGEPVVLLHGFGGDLNNWLFNVAALSGDRAVYSLDLPGHGGSSKDVGDGDLAALSGALRGFLDSQGIEQVAPRRPLDGRPRGRDRGPRGPGARGLADAGGQRRPGRARSTASTSRASSPPRGGATSSRCSSGCSPTRAW